MAAHGSCERCLAVIAALSALAWSPRPRTRRTTRSTMSGPPLNDVFNSTVRVRHERHRCRRSLLFLHSLLNDAMKFLHSSVHRVRFDRLCRGPAQLMRRRRRRAPRQPHESRRRPHVVAHRAGAIRNRPHHRQPSTHLRRVDGAAPPPLQPRQLAALLHLFLRRRRQLVAAAQPHRRTRARRSIRPTRLSPPGRPAACSSRRAGWSRRCTPTSCLPTRRRRSRTRCTATTAARPGCAARPRCRARPCTMRARRKSPSTGAGWRC